MKDIRQWKHELEVEWDRVPLTSPSEMLALARARAFASGARHMAVMSLYRAALQRLALERDLARADPYSGALAGAIANHVVTFEVCAGVDPAYRAKCDELRRAAESTFTERERTTFDATLRTCRAAAIGAIRDELRGRSVEVRAESA